MDTEQKPSAAGPAPDNRKTPGGRKTGVSFLPVLIVVLLLAGGGLGYYAWLELNKRLDQAAVSRQSIAHDVATIDESAKFQNFKKELQEQLSAFDQRLLELSGQVEQQASQQESLNGFVQEILARINRSQLGWGLKEALHVLYMASHRLRIERDIAGAITALNTASSRLHELNDPRLLPIRESISRQIGKLKTVSDPDWVGISLQFNTILTGIRLDIDDTGPQPNTSQDPPGTERDEPGLPAWRKLVEHVKDSVGNSITITREEQKSKLFVSRQEKRHAYEFLRVRVLGAKYALASRDDESYHLELEAAIAWLKTTDSLTDMSDLIDELNGLNDIDLEPELPDISEPATLLAEALETIENR